MGLAIGRALALTGQEVIVLEAADAIGTSTSSRNSEVVHSGMAAMRHTPDCHAMMPVKAAACKAAAVGAAARTSQAGLSAANHHSSSSP